MCCTKVARRGVPIAPSAMRLLTLRRSAAKRNSWATRPTRPAAAAAAHIASASALSSANGFSHNTCTPASRASSTSGAWVSGGVATVTASTPSASAFAQRGTGVRDLGARCSSGRAIAVGPDERDDIETRGAQRRYVHATAEARADDGDAGHRSIGRTSSFRATACATGSSRGHPYSGRSKYSMLSTPP